MFATKRSAGETFGCLVWVAWLGCGSASARPTPVPRPANVTAVSTSTPPRGGTTATEDTPPRLQIARPPLPDPTSDAGGSPPVECVAPASAIDPRAIVGYVSSRRADDALEGRFDGDVLGVDIVPVRDELVEWRIQVRRLGGSTGTGTINVYAPRALPPPLTRGQRVRASVRGVGGGPNGRYDLVFHAPDGSLLLAVNQTPDGWLVERGRRAGVRSANGYTERTYGVRFEHGDRRIDVAAGTWSRADVDGCAYYLWGSAAQRELWPGRPAMPDYVGGWLDSAIVRAR